MQQLGKNSVVNPITEGVIWKQLLLFFFPLVFGSLFQQIYNTADTIVVGRFVGKEALAAVGGSAAMIVNLVVGFFVGLASGASVVIAQYFGARDERNLTRTMYTAVTFSAIAGLVIGLVCILLSEPILRAMGTPEDSMAGALLYLQIFFLGMAFNLLYNMGSGVLRALGDSRRPVQVLIVTCLLNVVLDIVLVVVLPLGVAGVALATLICQGISALWVLFLLFRSQEFYRLEVKKIRLYPGYLRQILRIGIPAGMESVTYNLANVLIQVYVNKLGTDSVAAWSTLGKIDAFYWLIMNAFGISITTFVGQNYGAGRVDRMRKSVRVCMALAFGVGCTVVISFLAGGKWIFSFFTTDITVQRLGMEMMRLLLPYYPIYIIIGILSGALRGAGRVLYPMLFSVLGICGIRVLWLFGYAASHPGIKPIILNYPISWSITAVLFLLYYWKAFPKERKDL